jgi:hypothetical protein
VQKPLDFGRVSLGMLVSNALTRDLAGGLVQSQRDSCIALYPTSRGRGPDLLLPLPLRSRAYETLSLFQFLGPRILQRDRAIEDEFARARVGIEREVGETLELVAHLGICIRQ